MEYPPSSYYMPPVRRPAAAYYRERAAPAVRWVKEWIPQDLAASGGRCKLFRWVRADIVKGLKEKAKDPEVEVPKPEPTTEILFLCSYEGCGRTFVDVGALRKHAHVHGERQHVCHYAGCGKKFLDSSKLKRHFLIHTGARDFVCPYEGCGKAFSLDFNLRAHMKTHSAENYHICPYPDCGKRYTNELKLRSHIKALHEKSTILDAVKNTPQPEKLHSTPKPPAPLSAQSFADRPYVCPYDGCGKAYIHEYKLNLHLRREHPGHNSEETSNNATPAAEQMLDETNDHDAYVGMGGIASNPKKSKLRLAQKIPQTNVVNVKAASSLPLSMSGVKKQWPGKAMYEEDSEETEEEQENHVEEGWRYGGVNGDDEETEDED